MRRAALSVAIAAALAAGCASSPEKRTLGDLHAIEPDVAEVPVTEGLEQAMQGYRRFLDETPETELTPEAMRRLADLQIEKQFGIRDGDVAMREMEAPERADIAAGAALPVAPAATAAGELAESEQDFEARASASMLPAPARTAPADPSAALQAIAIYDRLLTEYPAYEHNDQVLYQKARAYDELGRTEDAMETMQSLIATNAHSTHYDEVQFRRGEYFFTRRKFRDAESAYSAIIGLGPESSYYEFALYKLGWTLYKQEFYDDAQRRFMALLDYKVSTGYDFDQKHEEDEERRVADTFRVISLGFSNLGGPDVVREYFAENGRRDYENRIYANLGEFYLAKLRYDDAAKTYKAFVALNPFHRSSPRFSMRVIEIYAEGKFPKLVLEAKKEFAATYGLQADYWRHFDPEQSPEVLSYLKSNLRDLAGHYHALYQNAEFAAEKPANFAEAQRWYREFLASFPRDPESAPINYQLADLMLENGAFGEAALEYERTAYSYPAHEKSAAAGYAAIFAHRQNLKAADEAQRDAVRADTVASSLKFADAFPDHEQAPRVLGAAADDLYGMKDFRPALAAAQKLIDRYPAAEPALRRSAFTVVAHSSLELAEYPQAEQAYGQVLALTPAEDKERQALVDNLAAAIYKQGEQANAAQDYRAAADNFLRVGKAAPGSQIHATAEYDAAAALVRMQDWAAAAAVLEAFRTNWPDHELNREATRELALAYRQNGQLSRAAGEYERVASEASDPDTQGDALLVAGELYEQSGATAQALAAYQTYVDKFPRPLDAAIETRFKIAGFHQATHDDARYFAELEQIVRVDAEGGAERTSRTRTLAARSALVLSERSYREFAAFALRQPFEESLAEKKRLMDGSVDAFERLMEYGIGEVTAAATYYLAEIQIDFSRSLMSSERPAGMPAADLADYELALEEEAFPFEEQAIAIHEKNLELVRKGTLNAWTDKSLARLAELVPVRYAKEELSSGYLGSIGRYAYVAPAAPQSASADSPPAELPQTTRADDAPQGEEATLAGAR